MMIGRSLLLSFLTVALAQRRFEDLFNENLVETLNQNLTERGWLTNGSLINSAGVIAYYARIRRHYARSPTGERLNASLFPTKTGNLNHALVDLCRRHIKNCIIKIEDSIRNRFPEIFENNPQAISEILFHNYHMDAINSYDATFNYIFCFFAHNHLLLLRALPFCDIGPDQEKYKPGVLYPDASSTLFDWDREEYQCAIESFCPDPCYGRARDRHRDSRNYTLCHKHTHNKKTTCSIDSKHNRNVGAMLVNNWNLTCVCEEGLYYNHEVKQCVDVNECANTTHPACPEPHEVCVNTYGSHLCMCKIGAHWQNGKCNEYTPNAVVWYGLAHESDADSLHILGVLSSVAAVFLLS
uniref:EGF_CA domain-containing protein n=1 Tax=Steinernema glaseri TaxID=37863 RepID=A0A1I7YP07_9BILA